MKLKYFLRGAGVGIIFGVLIMLVAYLTSGAEKLSDKEIIERAENLGMVMEEDLAFVGAKEDESDTGTSEAIIQDSDISIEEVVDESINTTTETSTSTEVTTENVDSTYVTAKISVTSGMTSSEVALLLENAGIIDDYIEFDEYLNDNDYSTQIRINDYEFNSGMTYEEIAQALIKEDKTN